MARIVVENLYKVFGRGSCERPIELAEEGESREAIREQTGCTVAVRDASFTVEDAEIFVIMGLSGSGKSTLLRCVNRLVEPTQGAVRIDEDDIRALEKDDLLAYRKRRISMVFQHFGLLEHRTVLENAAFALELQELSPQERKEKGRKALSLVGLEGYDEHRVDELSGGMRQRVGLARALAAESDVMLMDEAFSALDPLIRTTMQMEFLDLQKQYPKTILFITHDLAEALVMGDRIAIMKDGAIVQTGTPETIVTQPADDYVASFVENVDRTRVVTVGTAMEPAAAEDFEDDAPEPLRKTTRLIEVLRRVAREDRAFPVTDDDDAVIGRMDRRLLLEAIAGDASDASSEQPSHQDGNAARDRATAKADAEEAA